MFNLRPRMLEYRSYLDLYFEVCETPIFSEFQPNIRKHSDIVQREVTESIGIKQRAFVHRIYSIHIKFLFDQLCHNVYLITKVCNNTDPRDISHITQAQISHIRAA